jgi:hypothetical protein
VEIVNEIFLPDDQRRNGDLRHALILPTHHVLIILDELHRYRRDAANRHGIEGGVKGGIRRRHARPNVRDYFVTDIVLA